MRDHAVGLEEYAFFVYLGPFVEVGGVGPKGARLYEAEGVLGRLVGEFDVGGDAHLSFEEFQHFFRAAVENGIFAREVVEGEADFASRLELRHVLHYRGEGALAVLAAEDLRVGGKVRMILQKLAPFRFYVQRREAVRMVRVYDVEVLLRYGGYFFGGESLWAQYRVRQRDGARVAALRAHRAEAEDYAHEAVVLPYSRRPAAEVLRVADAAHRGIVVLSAPASGHADDDYTHVVVAELVAAAVVLGRGEEGARVYAAHFVFDGLRALLERPLVVAEEGAEVFPRKGVLHVVLEAARAAYDDGVVHVCEELAYAQRDLLGQRRQQKDALHALGVAACEQRVERRHALKEFVEYLDAEIYRARHLDAAHVRIAAVSEPAQREKQRAPLSPDGPLAAYQRRKIGIVVGLPLKILFLCLFGRGHRYSPSPSVLSITIPVSVSPSRSTSKSPS